MTNNKINKSRNQPSIRCCKVCEETQPIDNFSSNRNSKYPNSRRHTCRECEKIQTNNRNKRNYYIKKKRLEEENRIAEERFEEAERQSENRFFDLENAAFDEEEREILKDKLEKLLKKKVSIRSDGNHCVLTYKDDNDLEMKESREPTKEEMEEYQEWLALKEKEDKKYDEEMIERLGIDNNMNQKFKKGEKIYVVKKIETKKESIEEDVESDIELIEQPKVIETLDDTNY